MKRIYVPTRNGSDWQRLLAKPQLHWKRGKSAMTTAASWEDARSAFPREIETLLNSSHDEALVEFQLLLAIPEWEVALEGGDTASHTDVLAIARNAKGRCVVAVEAKVDESFGPLPSEKRAEATSGRSARIDFLQSMLCVAKFEDNPIPIASSQGICAPHGPRISRSRCRNASAGVWLEAGATK